MPNGQPTASDAAEAAAEAIQACCTLRPRVGLVLGSGLGDLADLVEQATVIPYADLPGHPRATVPGHSGQLIIGRLEGVAVAVWRGRAHFYEGWSMADVGFPVRLLHRLGGQAVLLTNAAGGLSPELAAGDLMLIEDHISLPGLAGHGPLRSVLGSSEDTRFVDLSRAYDEQLRALAARVAADLGIALHSGVYVMVAGPNYETPAEGRMLRLLGAGAVGMSTVPETVVARQIGLRVLGLSAITNVVLSPDPAGVTHSEVLAAAERVKPRFTSLVRGILAGMPKVLDS